MLVVPAHGPRQVRVILCDQGVNWMPFVQAAKARLDPRGRA
jgi:hypothetical protein